MDGWMEKSIKLGFVNVHLEKKKANYIYITDALEILNYEMENPCYEF